MGVLTLAVLLFLSWRSIRGDRDSCSPNLSPRAGILKQAVSLRHLSDSFLNGEALGQKAKRGFLYSLYHQLVSSFLSLQ